MSGLSGSWLDRLGFRPVLNERTYRAALPRMAACDNYTRPKGILGGSCSRCGAPQPLHALKKTSRVVDLP